MDTPASPTPSVDLLNTEPAPPAKNKFWEFAHGRPPGVTLGPSMKVQITHDMIIDFLIANPRASRKEIAEAFDYKSLASITIILNSDSFQARFAKRREQMVDPVVAASVEDRIRGLAARSAELLAEKLEISPTNDFLLEVFKESTRAGAYGVKAATPLTQSFVVNLPGPAASSREWQERFAPGAETVRPILDNAVSEVETK